MDTLNRPHSIFSVRDFGYSPDHELHYGLGLELDLDLDLEMDSDLDDQQQHLHRASFVPLPNWKHLHDDNDNDRGDDHDEDDGPPWLEDQHIHSHDNDEIHGKAIALFDFQPENDNEVQLTEGQVIWISYRHGQGWLVAEDDITGETGLVPEEYVQLINEEDHDHDQEEEAKNLEQPKKAAAVNDDSDCDWVDEDENELPEIGKLDIK